jgi:Xaa-Pro aminopeptidase
MLLNVDRAKRLMDARSLDGVIAATLENCFYLTGAWNDGQEQYPYDTEAFVVATRDKPEAGAIVSGVGGSPIRLEAYDSITDVFVYGTHYREVAPDVELTPDEEWVKQVAVEGPRSENAFEALCGAIEKTGLSKAAVGVDERGPIPDLLERLQGRFPEMRIEPAFSLFRQIRMVKTPEELERLRGALRGTERGILAVGDAAKAGVTEREMAQEARAAMTLAGCLPLWATVRFGRNMAFGVTPSDTQLSKGDYIFFDVGCTYQGYRSDIGRLYSYGEPSEKLRRIYEATKAGQSRAFELLTPGRSVVDVFNGTVERVREAGIPHYRRHHVGHGIGIEWYDQPVLTPTSPGTIELGMVFEVETPYYELGFGGSMIEDFVVVSETGAVSQMSIDRDLRVLDA